MTPQVIQARWFKSSASSVTGCVEVAYLPGGQVAVRDSKDAGGQAHVFGRREWAAFVSGLKRADVASVR
ncbi:MAG TPA: DUF397 domain-containing protein [Streptosporangiaceae bacterium]|nr:DUF397 domain-containing protein [Streptosporangiaceae bacterium]